jgi:tetratricopeptide (TPR) repeat protein
VLEARVQAKAGDHDAAISALDAILAAAPKGSAQAREATLAKAESLAATKKFAEAEAAVQEVIAESDPEDDAIQAEAHNTLGDCLRAAGRPKDALIAYLKTDVLYDGARDQHARALAQIAALWTELKQDARASEVRARLKQLYPQSPYAKAG